tara:strand:- start:408 stop:764 length:357 start_codon:yes stop_codon:yes gene_type:complete
MERKVNNMTTNKKINIAIAAIILFILITLAIWSVVPAKAQTTNCIEIKSAIQKLKKLYGEVPIFRGVSKGGHVVVVFLNPESKTWTAGRITQDDPAVVCPLDVGGEGYLRPIIKGKGI